MLKRQGLQLLLQLALAVQAFANFTSTIEDRVGPLRIAFAPHPFLSHWAVSAPIAHELLQHGHKALVSASRTPLVSEHVPACLWLSCSTLPCAANITGPFVLATQYSNASMLA